MLEWFRVTGSSYSWAWILYQDSAFPFTFSRPPKANWLALGLHVAVHWLFKAPKAQKPLGASMAQRLKDAKMNKPWFLTPRLLVFKSGYKYLLMIWIWASYLITWSLSFRFLKHTQKIVSIIRSCWMMVWGEMQTKCLAQHVPHSEYLVCTLLAGSILYLIHST